MGHSGGSWAPLRAGDSVRRSRAPLASFFGLSLGPLGPSRAPAAPPRSPLRPPRGPFGGHSGRPWAAAGARQAVSQRR
eukprot:5989998-Pyramimonas_sp.AAC.1